MSDNLYDLFRSRFPANRSRPFIETETGRVYSYADLEAVSGRYARLLSALGVRKGDPVAVQVEKSPEAIFLYLACLRAGAIYLPLNTAYTRHEIEYFVSDSEPGVIVCRPGQEDAFKAGTAHILSLGQDGEGTLPDRSASLDSNFPTVPANGHELAAILYTSGTTGRSKGAMMSHSNLASNALTLHS